MGVEKNKALVRRYPEAVSRGKLEILGAGISP